ncbi:MAG: hypothetical protein WCK11_04545 [Candidatus Falkowbacteria bacterium]
MEKILKLFDVATSLSSAELELPNFKAAVIEQLHKSGGQEDLIKKIIADSDILLPYVEKMITAGKAQEKNDPNYNSHNHLISAASEAANDLIEADSYKLAA